jgi:hypothetical protein
MGLKRDTSAFATPITNTAPIKADGSAPAELGTVKATNAKEAAMSISGAQEATAKSILHVAAGLIVAGLIVLWLLGGIALRNVNL